MLRAWQWFVSDVRSARGTPKVNPWSWFAGPRFHGWPREFRLGPVESWRRSRAGNDNERRENAFPTSLGLRGLALTSLLHHSRFPTGGPSPQEKLTKCKVCPEGVDSTLTPSRPFCTNKKNKELWASAEVCAQTTAALPSPLGLATPRKYALLPRGYLEFDSEVNTGQNDEFKGSFHSSYSRLVNVKT